MMLLLLYKCVKTSQTQMNYINIVTNPSLSTQTQRIIFSLQKERHLYVLCCMYLMTWLWNAIMGFKTSVANCSTYEIDNNCLILSLNKFANFLATLEYEVDNLLEKCAHFLSYITSYLVVVF